MIDLPKQYLNEIKDILKDEYYDYFNTFTKDRTFGLRINTNKISVEDWIKISPFKLAPIPWTNDGFYYDENDKPTKHPYYYAGLYYIQEPSAMLPAQVLPIEENDIVLDACAAPGGKTSKLANKLNGSGLLIANDISISRTQVLLKTLETQGVINSIIMSEDINNINLNNFFDKILIDVPCSGEGMFRKHPELVKSWLEKGSDYYVPIQKQIIKKTLDLLKDGGKLVYSTCTFSKKENEEIIEYALSICPSLKILPIKHCNGFMPGLSEKTKECIRLYPHKIKGEGHFVALLQKNESKQNNNIINNICELPNDEFFKNITNTFKGNLISRENKLYIEPNSSINTKGLRVLRSGLYLGEYKHNKFEPSQALAMCLTKNNFKNVINFDLKDDRVIKYLKCETINVKDRQINGYVLVCLNNYPLGFGKVDQGLLKNKYPVNYRYQ